MNLIVLLGTRPEAIKLAPVILQLKKISEFNTLVVSTGQHVEMLTPILEFFKIRPDLDLRLMKAGQSLTDLTSAVMSSLEREFAGKNISGLVVQGDTATCMAGSMWAFLNKIPVFHVEAGLRTGDRMAPWPEEFNRRVTAVAATLHFAPTVRAEENLLSEGISSKDVSVVGNTVVDAVKLVCQALDQHEDFGAQFPFLDASKKLILATVHRRENFGRGLDDVFTALRKIAEREDVQVVLPLHMNPMVRAAAHTVLAGSNVVVIDPQPYIPFVYLMRTSQLILTDSGGIQEEAWFLRKPVLVLRETTERPESVEEGVCKLVGTHPDVIRREADAILDGKVKMKLKGTNPYGVGDSAERIAREIRQLLCPHLFPVERNAVHLA